jgi:hypothetical protein
MVERLHGPVIVSQDIGNVQSLSWQHGEVSHRLHELRLLVGVVSPSPGSRWQLWESYEDAAARVLRGYVSLCELCVWPMEYGNGWKLLRWNGPSQRHVSMVSAKVIISRYQCRPC